MAYKCENCNNSARILLEWSGISPEGRFKEEIDKRYSCERMSCIIGLSKHPIYPYPDKVYQIKLIESETREVENSELLRLIERMISGDSEKESLYTEISKIVDPFFEKQLKLF